MTRRSRTLSALALATLALTSTAARAEPTERELRIPGPDGPLVGTLAEPGEEHRGDDPGPAVLILPGSGPTDRDGNSPMGIAAATYRLIADGLAERGIPSLRADKRGLFGSAAAVVDGDDVLVSDYVADAHAWSAALRAETASDCIVSLGHSEGALVALAMTANAGATGSEDDKSPDGAGADAETPIGAPVDGTDGHARICAVVLVASPGRPLGDILREQLAANPAYAPFLDEASAAIDALENGERVAGETLSPELVPLFRPPVQGFLIELFAIDPAALLARLDVPVLIVQGERDLQVGLGDAEALAKANPDATLVRLPDANHVLKSVPADDREANFAAYRDPGSPLADGVVEAIADFLDAL